MSKLFPNQQKILVMGDAILDVYYSGRVDRVSPEAPVPVVQVTKNVKKLGGAANVANNISKLSGQPFLISYCGKDANCEILQELLNDNDIESSLIKTNSPTITKIRVVSGVQQIVRIDFEEYISEDVSLENAKIEYLEKNLPLYKIVVLSDYGKGFVTDNFCRNAILLGNNIGVPVIIDPKGKDWEKYRGATIVTPNVKELSDVAGYRIDNQDCIIELEGEKIRKKYGFKYLLLTRSEKGMSFFSENQVEHIRTEATEVFDVSGAGDTVVATLAQAVSAGYTWIESVKLANKAAGVVVSKIGTEPVFYDELERSIYPYREEQKIIGIEEVSSLVDKIKQHDKKIVFTNGCFDIIHQGHIRYLQEAKRLGDILILGLNSDSSIKRLKGQERPIKDQDERALILSALEMVDYVTIFEDDTPYNLIEVVKPDVLVKGGDYLPENIVGREFARETVIVPFVDGYSTSSTIEKIKKV